MRRHIGQGDGLAIMFVQVLEYVHDTSAIRPRVVVIEPHAAQCLHTRCLGEPVQDRYQFQHGVKAGFDFEANKSAFDGEENLTAAQKDSLRLIKHVVDKVEMVYVKEVLEGDSKRT